MRPFQHSAPPDHVADIDALLAEGPVSIFEALQHYRPRPAPGATLFVPPQFYLPAADENVGLADLWLNYPHQTGLTEGKTHRAHYEAVIANVARVAAGDIPEDKIGTIEDWRFDKAISALPIQFLAGDLVRPGQPTIGFPPSHCDQPVSTVIALSNGMDWALTYEGFFWLGEEETW